MSMSSKPNRKRISAIQAISTQVETGEVSVVNSARHEEIRRRAFEIYLERGEQPGRELDDWLQAGRELERGMFLGSLGARPSVAPTLSTSADAFVILHAASALVIRRKAMGV
jgi:hypothetical protein